MNWILFCPLKSKNFFKSLMLMLSIWIVNLVALPESIYDFKLTKADGSILDLSQYKEGNSKQLLLFVNVASKCGFTNDNYNFFQNLATQYSDDLEIIAIPCNQFGKQEPHSDQDIMNFVENRYNLKVNDNNVNGSDSPSIQMLSKTLVNGENSNDLIKFLKFHTRGFVGENIPWNFNKFLVVNGVPTTYYVHDFPLKNLERDIRYHLQKLQNSEF